MALKLNFSIAKSPDGLSLQVQDISYSPVNKNKHNFVLHLLYLLGSKNKGYKMLTKMGWDGGGLGKGADGIEEPVRVEQRAAQAGLGSQAVSIVQVSLRINNWIVVLTYYNRVWFLLML